MKRRKFLAGTLGVTMSAVIAKNIFNSEISSAMPALFFGHGSPMNILAKNQFTENFRQVGESLERPSAILVVSAHWVTSGTKIEASPKPKQIFDFYGFPDELYKVSYTPEGSPALAATLAKDSPNISSATDWGLDHGSWAILHHIYPLQNIPVLQLSLDRNLAPKEHLKIAYSLQGLQKNGVLILGSGNIVHNLSSISWDESAPPHEWAVEFENHVIEILTNSALSREEKVEQIFKHRLLPMAHPTIEHLLPLVYTIALTNADKAMTVLVSGIQNASVSMAAVSS